MPVELPIDGSEIERPSTPTVIIWLSLFVICLVGGVVVTILTWPKNEPTETPWFWIKLIGFPMLAWCLLFGLRLHFYEEESNRLAAEDEVRQADRQQAIEFASEPLGVLDFAYICEFGMDGLAGAVLKKKCLLVAQKPKPDMPAIRHTALRELADAKLPERARSVFMRMLTKLEDALRAIPARVPFEVCLQLPSDVDPVPFLNVWETCWEERSFRPARAAPVPTDEGLMTLDSWLDVYGGTDLEKITLFVALQLYADPPENSAEAAVALLLGWAPMMERHDLAPVAMLHRPVQCESNALAYGIRTAAMWGGATPAGLNHLWQSGLSHEDKASVLIGASEVALGVVQDEKLTGVHDIDTALGHVGASAAWFAVALAIEGSMHGNEPQLIVCREGAMRMTVLRPAVQQYETETV